MSNSLIFELSENKRYYICAGLAAGANDTIIKIPDTYEQLPVKSIKSRAFSEANINELYLGNKITTIGEQAFYNCNSLTKIMLPYTLNSLGNGAFEECRNLALITFLCKGDFQCSTNNNIFKNAGVDNIEGIEVRCGYFVEHIPGNLFCPCGGNNAPNLHKITFEKGIIKGSEKFISRCASIGINAFNGCEELMSFEIPESLSLKQIDPSAFYNCVRMVEILQEFINNTEEIKQLFPNVLLIKNKNQEKLPISSIKHTNKLMYTLENELNPISLKCYVLSVNEKNYIINAPRSKEIQFARPAEKEYIINKYAFSNKGVEKICIGEFLGEDGNYHEGFFSPNTNIPSAVVRSCVTEIGDYAFFSNPITKAFAPKDLKKLGAFAFSNTNIDKVSSEIEYWPEIGLIVDDFIFMRGSYNGQKFIHSEALSTVTEFSAEADVYLCPYAFCKVYGSNEGKVLKKFDFGDYNIESVENSFFGIQCSSNFAFVGAYDTLRQLPEDVVVEATLKSDITEVLKQSKIKTLIMENSKQISPKTLTCWNSLITAEINNLGSTDHSFRSLFTEIDEASTIIEKLTIHDVEQIGGSGLQNLTKLATLALPKTLKTINGPVFSGTTPQELYLSSFDDWCEINFKYDTQTVEYNGMTPFNRNCSNGLPIQNIYINNNSIAETEVSLKRATKISNLSLYNCPFSDLTIPETVTEIGNNALYNSQIMNLTVAGPAVQRLSISMWQHVKKLKIYGDMGVRSVLTDKTMANIVTLDLSQVQSQLKDGFLSNLSSSKTLDSLYLRSLKQNADGTPLYLINGSVFKRSDENGKTVNYGDTTVTPLGRLFQYSTTSDSSAKDEISYLFGIKTQGGSDGMQHYAPTQTNIKYCSIPNSLKNLYIKEGYVSYNAFGTFAGRDGVNIYVGENVQPSRRCYYDVDGKNCFNSNVLGKAEGPEDYKAQFFLYAGSTSGDLDLSKYDGIADYALGWERFGFNFYDKYGKSKLKYIGIRSLAACMARDTVKFMIGETTYAVGNSINMPPSVKTIGYLAFDSVTCNAVCLPTSVEKINSCAFDKLVIGQGSYNSEAHSIVFVKPPEGTPGICANVVSTIAEANSSPYYYYYNIFRKGSATHIHTLVVPKEYNGEAFGANPSVYRSKEGLI